MTLVAIHQPTFLPYLGWWQKLVRAEIFVLLDDVQFPKKGGTWINRVRILTSGKPTWLTIPVARSFHGTRSVREMTIDDTKSWREQVARKVSESYSRAPFHPEVQPLVEAIVHDPADRLVHLNERAIQMIAEHIAVPHALIVRQSDLGSSSSAGTDLLIEIVRAVGGNAYLTGDGASGYLEPEKFSAAGLNLVEQQFVSPHYPQPTPTHVPGLSIVDALMSVGFDGVRSLLIAGQTGGSPTS